MRFSWSFNSCSDRPARRSNGAGSISCFRSAARARRAGNPVAVGSRRGRLRRSCPRRSCTRRCCPRRCCPRRSCPRHPSPITPLVTYRLPSRLSSQESRELTLRLCSKDVCIAVFNPRIGVRRDFYLALMRLCKFLEIVNLNAGPRGSGRFPTPPHVRNGCAKALNTRARWKNVT
jgi:hypothetical protein